MIVHQNTTLVHIVARYRILSALNAILRNACQTALTLDPKDSNDQMPLLWAARNGHEAVVKLLLETNQVEVNSRDSRYGRTTEGWDTWNGRGAVVKPIDLCAVHSQTTTF